MTIVCCDVCGAEVLNQQAGRLTWKGRGWNLDLCDAHMREIDESVHRWTASAAQTSKRRSRAVVGAEWDYLESLGFARHRGRKSQQEVAALAAMRD